MEKGYITYSDIYTGLWKCRDFELAHYWQRAVFLTAFLLACYAGYGTLIVQCATAEQVCLPFWAVNGIAFGICIIGILLSLLWIIMAKGSKAWYEIYEAAINAFVRRYNGSVKAFEGDLWEVAGFGIRDAKEFENPAISDWLWNSIGGRYSVSRVNVAIGHLSALIWTGLALLHVYLVKSGVKTVADLGKNHWLLSDSSLMCASVIIILLLFWVYVKMVLKSSHID